MARDISAVRMRIDEPGCNELACQGDLLGTWQHGRCRCQRSDASVRADHKVKTLRTRRARAQDTTAPQHEWLCPRRALADDCPRPCEGDHRPYEGLTRGVLHTDSELRGYTRRYRRRAERQEQRPHVRRQLPVAVPLQRRHQFRQEGHQPLATDLVRRCPGVSAEMQVDGAPI